MVIRKLTPADAERYRDIRLRSLKEHPDAFLTTYEVEITKPLETIRHNLQPTADKFTLGAFSDEGELAGVVTLVRESNPKLRHKANLYAMYVAPEYRKQRLGQALVSALLMEAKTCAGLERVHLTVISSNQAAKRLYESLGFVCYATEKQALKIDGAYWDEDFLSIRV
ncbi:GNAT family N-acetyltransferase [Paenibacillus sp. OAS669]|uniref:GNAT family N-acetyltransferase n=1 Tax=Paenibacillus sp. OAS669 TaxID=2663821 RepID=UPI00178A9B85|nr:GNAT family N-acetyltransferase [Paenibacillus sp. OAS669]MBE1441643.1 RimJ/RimL family protein N-acetyltransferase [Paenibacillus sp. OAS669]